MARILRGDVVWAELNPVIGSEQAGRRPVVVISHDVFNERSGTVIAVIVTSQEPRAGFPLTLELTSAKLPKRSWVKIGQIRTLSVERLGPKNPEETSSREREAVIAALNGVLGDHLAAQETPLAIERGLPAACHKPMVMLTMRARFRKSSTSVSSHSPIRLCWKRTRASSPSHPCRSR